MPRRGSGRRISGRISVYIGSSPLTAFFACPSAACTDISETASVKSVFGIFTRYSLTIPFSRRRAVFSSDTLLMMEAATILFPERAGNISFICETILTSVFPVEISSSTRMTVPVPSIFSPRWSAQSFCSAAWLCSSRKYAHFSASGTSSRVVWIYVQSAKQALTPAPTAVAVSAKPMISPVSGYFSTSFLPSKRNSSSAFSGSTGRCFPCSGFTRRYCLCVFLYLFARVRTSSALYSLILTLPPGSRRSFPVRRPAPPSVQDSSLRSSCCRPRFSQRPAYHLPSEGSSPHPRNRSGTP